MLSFTSLLSLFLLILLRSPFLPPYSPPTTSRETHSWSDDLQEVDFSYNSLKLTDHRSPHATLRIVAFSWKWPVATTPGGMECHALTLHSTLALRGHDVHIFTSSPPPTEHPLFQHSDFPQLHFLSGSSGQWHYDEAWTLYEAEAQTGGPFDVIHSDVLQVRVISGSG